MASGEGEFDRRLGNVAAATNDLTEAAKRTIYERLVPLAFPVMYDLGNRIDNARNWYCDGASATTSTCSASRPTAQVPRSE